MILRGAVVCWFCKALRYWAALSVSPISFAHLLLFEARGGVGCSFGVYLPWMGMIEQ